MLAAVAKRAKLAFFDDLYGSLASNSNIKKPTVSASVHSKLWMTMFWNARPFGERDTLFLLYFFFGEDIALTEGGRIQKWVDISIENPMVVFLRP